MLKRLSRVVHKYLMRFIDIITESDLPMDKKSRMDRAQAMGFTHSAFHGTAAKFNEFEMERGNANHSGFAPFFADKRAEAKGYADASSGKVMSVLLRIRKPLMVPSTWATMPENVTPTDEETYSLITGGELPRDTERERALHNQDAIEHAMDVHYEETGNYDRREIWTKIYQRLIGAGYDAIIWEDVRADHHNGKYSKIVMLDMSGIRLTSAAFDPSKATSRGLRA